MRKYLVVFQRYKTRFSRNRWEETMFAYNNSIKVKKIKGINKEKVLEKAERIKKNYNWYRIIKCVDERRSESFWVKKFPRFISLRR